MSALDVQLPVPVRYTRSIHIQRDFSNNHIGVRDYQATPLVIQTAARILDGLRPDATERAFSLIGPYGSGKSAFGVFLAHYLFSNPVTRHNLLSTHATDGIPKPAPVEGSQLLPLIVSGNNESLRYSLLSGLQSLFRAHKFRSNGRRKLLRLIEEALEDKDVDAQLVADLIAKSCIFVHNNSIFQGILLLIDELGQFLDFAARQGDERELFVLQTIAEMAARSGDSPCVVMTILHQAFDRYTGTAGLARRTEWAKVQGRFVELPFQEPPVQLLRMVGRALCPDPVNDKYRQQRIAWTRTVAKQSSELGLRPPDLPQQEWDHLVSRAYPLHPAVLVALPPLFRQLAQNERSLFAFLTSPEPFSVPDVLREAQANGHLPIYRLSHLYEYVHANLGASLFGRARGQRWAELAEAQIQLGDSDELTAQVLTVIGTLGALGQTYGLRASREQITFALRDNTDDGEVSERIDTLIRRKLITYRQHRKSYIVWEGSDLDLEGMTQEARRAISDRVTLVTLLRQHANASPLIARRHSYQTGATRTFLVRFEDAALLNRELPLNSEADGELVYIVPADDAELEAAQLWASHADRAGETQRVIVLPRRVRELRDLLLDIAALRDVLANRPELESDGAARREISSRLVEAQQALTQTIAETYGPGYSRWFRRSYEVAVQTSRQVDELLSLACDETYTATPRIWNELIMRRQLSAAANKARRNLVEALLEHTQKETLGLVGYPPERAIYESVLRSGGLHRLESDGLWHIGPPPEEDPLRLRPTWEEMERVLNEADSEPKPLTDLLAKIEAPPFGIKAGLSPLLFAIFFVARAGEIVVYERGSYAPFPDTALFDRLLSRPEGFAVRLSRADGARIAVYKYIAEKLSPRALTQPVQPALLAACFPLLKVIRNLSDYGKSTKRISAQAQAIRAALRDSRSPDELLFENLPLACGMPPFMPQEEEDQTRNKAFFTAVRDGLQEIQETYPRLVDHIFERIREAFASSTTDRASLRNELNERYDLIASSIGDSLIRALGVRLETADDGDAWVESVAALVAKRPPDSWSDAEVATFESTIIDLGRRFRVAEQMAVAAKTIQPDAPVRRIGIANGKGEHSRVVRVGTPDATMTSLREELLAVLARYDTLTAEQRTAVLAELLEPLLIANE